MTTESEPLLTLIEEEANYPNITPLVTPNTHAPEDPVDTTSEPNLNDPVLQFIVQNFNRVNAMYTAFTHARKDIPHRSLATNGNPTVQPWNSDSEEAHPSKALGKTFVESDGADPTPAIPLGSNDTKGKTTQNVEFYHQPFVFKEPNRDTRYLIASPFTSRIRDYDMPDGLKVPANLKTYDGMSDPDDHLTIFMARFWYENLAPGSIDGFYQLRDKFRANFLQQRRFQKTQAEILGIRQRPDESLKDYVARCYGAFISGLRPGRLFKDLIARPPTSLEDLFTQTHNFIRAEDANNENRLREPRQGNRETKQHVTYKDLPRKPKDKFISRSATRYSEHRKAPHDGFTALVKSPEEIFATVEGNKRDKTKYCEFHEDHGHDTNDCIDLRKEIGAKTQNNSQATVPSGSRNNNQPQIDWNKREEASGKPKNEIHMTLHDRPTTTDPRCSYPSITFSEEDPGAQQ
ncbi:retrotransposon gag domain-containing protein [Artemisia annua]|uniref:Retrotransposon gag domain-containing protein n=1 Tax=Artemisia annua TaxID=35608 RepID=A0A2U1KTL5_ARTAN|nr:retrotransposon gag domain-containing protein [Artemisia annua]